MIDETLANTITEVAVKQLDAGLRHKQARMEKIKENERLYGNAVMPTLPGEFYIPVPIMAGFIDTLVSELNQPVRINFEKQEEADLMKSKKVTAMWEYDSSPTRGAWNIKDLQAKKLAGVSGRAIYAISSESDPEYKNTLINIHHYNFVTEPMGGHDLRNHTFKGHMNIFKSKSDLEAGGESGIYDKGQVAKLVNQSSEDTQKKTHDIFQNLKNTFQTLGLDPDMPSYDSGDKMFAMVQWVMRYKGTDYFLFFDPQTGIWVRAHELTEVFESGLDPYVSWATHEDPLNFWNKAPADDIRPIHLAMEGVFNQSYNNLVQRLRGKRAINPEYFPNISELEDFTTRFVEISPDMSAKKVSDGIFEIQTPDNTAIVINLMSFLDNFVGQKTGISTEAQGGASQERVGIHFANIEKTSRRMGLYSEFYKQAYSELGLRYFHGLREHLSKETSVKILGERGWEWRDLIPKNDLHPLKEFDIVISGGIEEEEINQILQQRKEKAIAQAVRNPLITKELNPKWLAEELLRAGGYEDSAVRRAMDLDTYGDRELLSQASEAIQDILTGKEPELNYRANTAFMQKIIDSANEKRTKKLDIVIYFKLLNYAMSHIDIIVENTVRKARLIRSAQNVAPEGAAPAPLGSPVPGLTTPEREPPQSPAERTPVAVPTVTPPGVVPIRR